MIRERNIYKKHYHEITNDEYTIIYQYRTIKVREKWDTIPKQIYKLMRETKQSTSKCYKNKYIWKGNLIFFHVLLQRKATSFPLKIFFNKQQTSEKHKKKEYNRQFHIKKE